MKCVYVVDTIWMGHIPTYHQLFTKHLLNLGYQVHSLCPKPEDMLDWVKLNLPQHLNNFRATVVIQENLVKAVGPDSHLHEKFFYKMGVEPYYRCLHWWKNLKTTIESAETSSSWPVHSVFLPGIEINIISLFVTGPEIDKIFPYKWFGLFISPKYLRKGLIKHWHKRALRKDRFFHAENCIGIVLLDEGAMPKMKEIFPEKNVIVLPDVTDSEQSLEETPLVKKFREFRKGKKVVGLLGELSKRKCITTLLDAAQKMAQSHPDTVFLFAGPMNEKNNNFSDLLELQTRIKNSPGNCYFILERIPTNGEFNDLFKECDIIFASYENFYHSSNVLTKAALFKKPAIVTEGYCMAERVLKFNLGVTIRQNNVDDCVSAIEQLLKSDLNNMNFQAFYDEHSPQKLDIFFQKVLKIGG